MNNLEKLRQKALISKVISWGIYPLLFILVMAGTKDFAGALGVALIFGSLVRMLYVTFSKNRAYTEFVQAYKKELVTMALNGGQLYGDMQIDFERGIVPQAVTDSGMLSANRFYSDCFISASYNGVSFVQSDVRNVRGERGGYVLEYDGTYLVIPTNLPDIYPTSIYNKDVDISIHLPGKDCLGTNEAFNKLFKVNTNNKDAVARILTPDFMNKLVNIQNQITGRIACTVRNGNMYIFLSKHGCKLKPSLFKKVDEAVKQDVINELSRAKYFIDAFGAK